MSGVDNWQDLGFANLQQVLDEQSSKINASQEEGAASRKALSAKTKAFRKLEDHEKLGEIRGLLKGYQAEIDALTGRCKFAEMCFMQAYKSLALLPDPAPLLNAHKAEIEKLKSEAAQSAASNEEDSRLARELERQTLRVAQLEKQLKSASPSNPEPKAADSTTEKVNELETQLAAKQAQLAKSQTLLKDEVAASQELRAKLAAQDGKQDYQQDYEALRRDYEALRAKLEDDGVNTNAGASSDDSGTTGTRKTRELEAQNAALKAEHEQLAADLRRNKQLVVKLEDDLSAMQPSDTFSTISGWTAVPRAGPGSLAAGSGGNSAVSGIIVQQRDRYKKRMQELEEKMHGTEAELVQSQKELETVKRESYKLYERIRQLQAAVPATSEMPDLRFEPKSLYEPRVEQQLKELDIGRRTMGMSPLNAKYVELCARVLVDSRLRTGVAAYAIVLHLAALFGFVF